MLRQKRIAAMAREDPTANYSFQRMMWHYCCKVLPSKALWCHRRNVIISSPWEVHPCLCDHLIDRRGRPQSCKELLIFCQEVENECDCVQAISEWGFVLPSLVLSPACRRSWSVCFCACPAEATLPCKRKKLHRRKGISVKRFCSFSFSISSVLTRTYFQCDYSLNLYNYGAWMLRINSL